MTPHDARILGPKNKPVHGGEAIHEYMQAHWYCLACGKAGDLTCHHIIGGRGGRSDEKPNLFACCWIPCHSEFCDQSRNLGVVLTMKLRAGELTAEDVERLEALNGHPLPDFAPIPQEMMLEFEKNRPELNWANYVHSWCRSSPDSISAIRPA